MRSEVVLRLRVRIASSNATSSVFSGGGLQLQQHRPAGARTSSGECGLEKYSLKNPRMHSRHRSSFFTSSCDTFVVDWEAKAGCFRPAFRYLLVTAFARFALGLMLVFGLDLGGLGVSYQRRFYSSQARVIYDAYKLFHGKQSIHILPGVRVRVVARRGTRGIRRGRLDTGGVGTMVLI